jgi:hypothetical protein
MTEIMASSAPVSLIPARPLDDEEQSTKLQRMGLDFLSSIHWVVIVLVALLFAAFVVLLKRHRINESARQIAEAEHVIETGRQQLVTNYFLPDGRVNAGLFPTPRHAPTDNEEVYAQDDVNEKLNSGASQTILSQLRRYTKSGKLFSFFNSTVAANDTVASIVERRAAANSVPLDEDQKLARSLRMQYGGDQLRNPLIGKQINDEIAYRREAQRAESAAATAEAAQVATVATLPATPTPKQAPHTDTSTCVDTPPAMSRLNERQLQALDAAFGE